MEGKEDAQSFFSTAALYGTCSVSLIPDLYKFVKYSFLAMLKVLPDLKTLGC